PPHDAVLAQVDVAHAAGADQLQHPVFTDVEAPPLALEEAPGLERGDEAGADERVGDLFGGRFGRVLGEKVFEGCRLDEAAFRQEGDEVRGSHWDRHGALLDSGRRSQGELAAARSCVNGFPSRTCNRGYIGGTAPPSVVFEKPSKWKKK